MQKLYYSIAEVKKEVDEETHILRYWEKEFPQLSPKKNRAGNRVYSAKDLALIKLIKKLLRDEKLSVKGAKQKIDYYNETGIDYSEVIQTQDQIEEKPKEKIEVDKELLLDLKNTLRELSAELKN